MPGRLRRFKPVAALHYASDLTPQDIGLRMRSAYQYLRDGKLAEVRKALVLIAFDPHGGEAAKSAQESIAKIDAGDGKGAQTAIERKGQAPQPIRLGSR